MRQLFTNPQALPLVTQIRGSVVKAQSISQAPQVTIGRLRRPVWKTVLLFPGSKS
jgi:hypothetical protein